MFPAHPASSAHAPPAACATPTPPCSTHPPEAHTPLSQGPGVPPTPGRKLPPPAPTLWEPKR